MSRAAVLALLLAGCQFTPGRARLREILAERPDEPYELTVFCREPGEDERDIAELRETLVYWSEPGAGGEPRWRGVLHPEPGDLYADLLERIDAGAEEVRLVAYRFDAVGQNVLSVVDYVSGAGELIGSDRNVYFEPQRPGGGPALPGYGDMAWWEYPQLLLDVPVYGLIGLKELAGEAVKSPLSALEGGWLGTAVEGRSPISPVAFERAAGGFLQDWKDGFTAFAWRFRARSRHTPLDLLMDLLGALPLAGPLFDHRSTPAGLSGPDGEVPAGESLVAISQGIHMGAPRDQNPQAWLRALEELHPRRRVVVVPYSWGGFLDTTWSILNLSQGTAHDAATRLVFGEGVAPGDALILAGYSGGVQRLGAATRLLRDAGIRVERYVGIAGPLSGPVCAEGSYLLLGKEVFDDPVVFTADFVGAVLFPLRPSASVVRVPGGGAHVTPYYPDAATRAPGMAYAPAFEEVIGGE